MLTSSAEVGRGLLDGCSRLGLPITGTTELLKFLHIKRRHDQLVDPSKRLLRMSPPPKLERLWHFMLLNTSVSTAVHDTLGGVVEHRGTDATDLSEQAKLLQQLYALNVVQLEGHYPNLSLWKELGADATETSELLRSVVPSLKHLPGGGQVYYHPSLSCQHRVQLVQALQLLYSDGEKMCDSTAQTPAAAPQRAAKPTVTGAIIAAAAAAKAAPATAGAGAPEPATSSAAGVGGPANAKRARTEQPAQPDKRRRLPGLSAPVCATTDSV